jgi:hypothetical protein
MVDRVASEGAISFAPFYQDENIKRFWSHNADPAFDGASTRRDEPPRRLLLGRFS